MKLYYGIYGPTSDELFFLSRDPETAGESLSKAATAIVPAFDSPVRFEAALVRVLEANDMEEIGRDRTHRLFRKKTP